jgi:DNA-binding NarL/FixJ family response regulator
VSRTQVGTEQERSSASSGQPSTETVRVLAVDDNQAFREALHDLIAAAPGFVLAGTASSGEQALDEFARTSPQLVLMDVMMPGIGGIAATHKIVGNDPNVVILLLSLDDPAGYLVSERFGESVGSLRKQDLSLQELRRTWNRLRG